MSIRHTDLRKYVIRPILKSLNLWSDNAEELLVATAAHESKGGYYLAQEKGPALGIYQMEPATYNDLWNNYLRFNSDVVAALLRLDYTRTDPTVMTYDLGYATAMCRLQYRRVPYPLPPANNHNMIAEYWHDHWCRGCAGTVKEFIDDYVAYLGK
jgi:hypothetical protein